MQPLFNLIGMIIITYVGSTLYLSVLSVYILINCKFYFAQLPTDKMNCLTCKNNLLPFAVFFLLIALSALVNAEEVNDAAEGNSIEKIVEESKKLQESATQIIIEGGKKFKERYIDNSENTADKLEEDAAKIRKIYMEETENAAEMVIDKTKEVGQKLLEESKNIVQKVSDIVIPEEVVNVGFRNAVNPETQNAARKINNFTLQHGRNTPKSGLSFAEQLREKIGINLSCDLSPMPPKNIGAEYLSVCRYAQHRFTNSKNNCMAGANNSLLLKSAGLINRSIQTICENACEHKKEFESCVEKHDKDETLTQREADKLAHKTIMIKNASAEYECIDNDLVISGLARLRQIVTLCKKDKNCDIKSEAFKQQYTDESLRILYFYDRGRDDLYETYKDDDFVEEHNTNSLFKTKNVSRALLTTDVVQREPVDNACTPANDKIMFFTEIKNYANHRVTHRWIYDNKTKYEHSFNVRGPRWRVWTSKNIYAKWVGPWVIQAVDEEGNILAQKLFYYTP